MKKDTSNIIDIFKANKGVLRTSEAIKAGIHPRTLYTLRDNGDIKLISRGIYRLANLPALSNPDFAAVAKRVPQGVICLISALAFHKLTTQIPHEIYIAVSRSAGRPRIHYPPIKTYQFGNAVLRAGIETHAIDGINVQVYKPEKTLADCFKYRNKIGISIFQEALKMYRQRRKPNFDKVLEYAKVCRVDRLIKPYLGAFL